MILNMLKDPTTPQSKRRNLLGELPRENGCYLVNRIPVGPKLTQMAQRWTSSTEALERRDGASLLGGVDGGILRQVLQQLALVDRNCVVRALALRALGSSGDQVMLDLLESYPPPSQGTNIRDAERVQQALDAARERLRRKFAK
jgi:hypothetical protein